MRTNLNHKIYVYFNYGGRIYYYSPLLSVPFGKSPTWLLASLSGIITFPSNLLSTKLNQAGRGIGGPLIGHVLVPTTGGDAGSVLCWVEPKR